MNLFNTLKSKSKPTAAYLVLLLGFVFSLFININFVSDRAVDSLTNFQSEHAELQAQTTFHNIQEFIKNRKELLAELAESTTVISSVLGIEVASMNIIDLLSEKEILGTKENIYITDFTGQLVYPSASKHFKRPFVFNKIMDKGAESVLTINEKNNEYYFSLSMPVKHNEQVEGIITFDLIRHPIENLLAELTKDNIYAASFIDNNLNRLVYKTEPLTKFSLVTSSLIIDTEIELTFYVSTSKLEQEKSEYVWQIGSTLAITTLVSFIILVFIIRTLLITPLAKLAESEKRVKLNEERYLLAVQGSNDGIWDWDLNDKKLHLSSKFLSMTGYSKDIEKEFIDPNILFLKYIHPQDGKTASNAFLGHVKEDIPLDFDFRMRVASGEYRYFRMRGIALKTANGRAVRMAGSLTDITEVMEQSLALEKALEAAKSANIAKSDFLANMSHEIRTPMNGVLGSLQLLKRDSLSDSSKELVDVGITSSKALLSIINDILDLSKIESNNISLECLTTNTTALFTTLHTELSLLTKEKGIQLTLSIEKDMPAYWDIDPIRLRQIVVNLVSNAIKFTLEGQVAITLYQYDKQFAFKVQDTGIGIPKDHINKLFNRFEQADSTTTRKFGGTGLGLSISKQLISLMKGNISVVSKENEGSTFTVTLPLSPSCQSPKQENLTEQIQAPDAQGLNILLAEDNKINQTIFNAVLAPTKATIVTVSDGIQAIKAIEEQLPDLIFMDIQMPNMDGTEACEIIKKTNPNTIIIALTANIMSDDVKKYKRSGFDFHLGKPLNVNDVYTFIEEFLSKRNEK